MATAALTIKTALRKLRVLGENQNPTSVRQENCLLALNGLLDRLIGFGCSVAFADVYASSSVEVDPRYPAQRILCRQSAALTVTLPEGTAGAPIADGFRVAVIDAGLAAATYNITIARNGWTINGTAANSTISTNGGSKILMFDASSGDWKLASDLTASDSLPFPAQFDSGFALMLADELTEFGQSLSRTDMARAAYARQQQRLRYNKPPVLYSDGARIGGATQERGVTSADGELV